MFDRRLPAAALAAAACMSFPAAGATDSDLAAVREEIRVLKAEYEARIGALEARLREAEVSPSRAAVPPAPESAAGEPRAAEGGLAAFNPAISVVLQGTYANLSRDPAAFALPGFQQAPDIGPGRRGLGLGESEINLSANVDDRFAGSLTVSLTPQNTVAVEEAFGFMPSLGNGIVPKFGRFFSGIGYLNEQHQHAWDFQDAPLAYQAFLGGQLAQDGVQAKWVAPTEQFVELGAELGRGDGFPGSERDRNGVGAAALFGHIGGDVGDSHSWRAGLSYLAAHPRNREGTELDTSGKLARVDVSGTSRTVIADFVWKYAPHGNAQESGVKLQGEYFWRRERGDLTYDPGGAFALMDRYASDGRGGYVQAVWQFRPAWRLGVRYDELRPGRPDFGSNADLLDIAFEPRRTTAMLDYTPSEFSRFRIQYAQSRTRPEATDHEIFLQYILTLGAHGAHRF